MFGSLFIKECRQTRKSLIYWIIIGCMVLFFFSQLGSLNIMEKPVPGKDDYGIKFSDDKNAIMSSALGRLGEECLHGTYTTYPIGFYKSVRPNETEQKRITDIFEETTGITDMNEVEKRMNEHYQGTEVIMTGISISPVDTLAYDRFENLMVEIDDILGGGSNYARESLKTIAHVPMTYEDALADYDALIKQDKLSGAYARLFCDYMGLILGILPVFLAVTRGLRDKRAHMTELIAVRKASAFTIISSRYLAMVTMLILPVLLLSCLPLAECIQYAANAGIQMNYLAFAAYSFGWLLPSIMIVTAVGMILTELFGNAIGVLIQTIWWFVTIFSGISAIQGGSYGWSLVPRHNTTGNYDLFHTGFNQLLANRITYAAAAIILVALTIWIYSLNRKGVLKLYGKVSANRKNKLQA